MNQRQTSTSKLAMLTCMYVVVSVIIVGSILILAMGSTYAQEGADREPEIPDSQAYLSCISVAKQEVGICYRWWRSDDSELIGKWLSAGGLDDPTHKRLLTEEHKRLLTEEIENWSIKKNSTPANSSSARTLMEPEFFELRSLWSSTLPEHLKDFSERAM